MNNILNIGFLVDGEEVDYNTYSLIKYTSENSLFNPFVIINKKPDFLFRKKKRTLKKTIFDLLIRKIRKRETKIVRKVYPNYLKSIHLSNINGLKYLYADSEWSKSGLYFDFSLKSLEQIKEKKIDLIVRCGSGILKGKILNITKFGVISIHNGDNRSNRGGPPGFWEVLNNEASSGFIIQKLNNELDGGDVIFRGNIMTASLWLMNDANITAKSNPFIKRIFNYVALNKKLPAYENISLHDDKLFKFDDKISDLLKYISITIFPSIRQKIKRIFIGKEIDDWNVAYSKFDNFKKSLFRYKQIKNPLNRYLADPFIFTKNGRSVIFVEDYFYKDFKGRISAVEIKNNSETHLGVVLEEPFHLSFPYIFEDKGKIYMLPEAHQSNQIRLYECIEFPLKWKFKMSLVKNVSAVDSLVIRKNEKWFLLTNICSSNVRDFNSELHIFYSNELLSDTWAPIKCGNPVIFDSRKARNGGIIYIKDQIYRINQVHNKNHYGKKFAINLIVDLNEFNYNEKLIDTIKPNFKNNSISTHHFTSNNYYSVIDYMKKRTIKKFF